VIDAFDEATGEQEVPPWAGPGIDQYRPVRRQPRTPERRVPERGAPEPRRAPQAAEYGEPDLASWPEQDRRSRLPRLPGRGRAAAARRRRSKRRLITWGSAAAAAALIAGLVVFLTQPSAKPSPYVTTFQKGEFKDVPNACKVVGAAQLHTLMKGIPKSIQPQRGQALSSCTFTVDAQPTFRVLNVQLQAMPASLVASGNGSATDNAKYTIAQQRTSLAKPPKGNTWPAAAITPVGGLGDQAFSAVQTIRTKTTSDLVTIWTRYRNVLISVSMQGQSNDGFGPVSVIDLRSAALTVAKAALSAAKGQPAV